MFGPEHRIRNDFRDNIILVEQCASECSLQSFVAIISGNFENECLRQDGVLETRCLTRGLYCTCRRNIHTSGKTQGKKNRGFQLTNIQQAQSEWRYRALHRRVEHCSKLAAYLNE